MALSFLKFKIPGRRTGKMNFSREDFIFWGLFLAFFLMTASVFWSAYVFYQTLFEERRGATVTSSFNEVSNEEIDEVMRILDEREKKFNEILAR